MIRAGITETQTLHSCEPAGPLDVFTGTSALMLSREQAGDADFVHSSETVLETFTGVVERIDSTFGYVTFHTQSGEEMWGEVPANELAECGIREGDRFQCQTLKMGDKVETRLVPIPLVVSEEYHRVISDRIDRLLADSELDGDLPTGTP
jgi:hypothetical protein